MVEADADEIHHDDLRRLGLAVGNALHAQPLHAPAVDIELQFLAAMPGQGVLLEAVDAGALRQGLQVDADVRVRGFDGCQEFSFASRVLQVFDYGQRNPPLAYALVGYPETVETRQVRRARRVRVSLPATARFADGRRVPGFVRNLSTAGALFESHVAPCAVGATFELHIATEFEGEPLELRLPASVCRLQEPDGTLCGIVFHDVPREDKLGLHYLVGRSE